MYHFRSNPPSRQIAPAPALAPVVAAGPKPDALTILPYQDPILERILAHCREKRIAFSAFGMVVAGDPRLISDMQNGRKLGRKLRAAVGLALMGELVHA